MDGRTHLDLHAVVNLGERLCDLLHEHVVPQAVPLLPHPVRVVHGDLRNGNDLAIAFPHN